MEAGDPSPDFDGDGTDPAALAMALPAKQEPGDKDPPDAAESKDVKSEAAAPPTRHRTS